MKKLINTFKDIFSIPELKRRIINTILLLMVFRLGSYVVLPGIDPTKLQSSFDDIRGLLDTFLGGAFGRASIFALGIMPYISASIVVQLLTVALPEFQKMQRKEGEAGRKKLTRITRLLTIAITLVQSFAFLATINSDALVVSRSFFTFSSVILLTTGTIFCMWLGERIIERGIGNGISLLIMIGIISRFPQAIYQEIETSLVGVGGELKLLLEAVALILVVMGIVMLTQAVRNVPVQYAKQVVGNKVWGGRRQMLPLRLNAAGVMPIIFAQSLMFLPAMLAGLFASPDSDLAVTIGMFSNPFTWQYNLVFGILIILFTFFYTAITIDPRQIAEDLKRSGGFIPGVKPGEPTAHYIDSILSKITLPGSIFLAIVAIIPAIVQYFGVSSDFAQFYGGTSLLIMVGVVADTVQQVDAYLIQKRYESLMKSGQITSPVSGTIDVA